MAYDGDDFLQVDAMINALFCDEGGALKRRLLSDGRELAVIPLSFARARIIIGPPGAIAYDDGW